jgi:catechol 2,3-dioxygenase-like lactoylglutathione lyase family enzyme
MGAIASEASNCSTKSGLPLAAAHRGLGYWADPRGSRPSEINHNDGGRGVYFRDPDGHYLEVITQSYGRGG